MQVWLSMEDIFMNEELEPENGEEVPEPLGDYLNVESLEWSYDNSGLCTPIDGDMPVDGPTRIFYNIRRANNDHTLLSR